LGVVLSKGGREEEAISEYRVALQFDPDSCDVMYNLAVSLQKLRRDEEAEQAYRLLLDRYPSDKKGWSNLGALLASAGRVEEAKQAFGEALRIDPNFSDSLQNLRILERMKPSTPCAHTSASNPSPPQSTISLCMIVRNEEENLPRLLEEVGRVVDEIVIVDTGSSDNTRAVAESHGATVYGFQWAHDFAAARNFSLSKATCGWILVLDADEALSADDFSALKMLTRDSRAFGFSFETRNYSRDSSLEGWRPAALEDEMARSFPGWFPSEKVRLFRNKPSIRFEGAIHELVEPSILRTAGAIERTSIPVHHYGYDRVAEKAEAYLVSARRKVSSAPDSAEAHFELGAVLYRLEQFDLACESLAKAVELAPGQIEYLVSLGDSLRAAGRNSEAEHAYRSAIRLRPGASAAHRGLGIVLFREGKIGASRKALEKAVELNPYDAQSLTNIGVIHVRCGNKGDAIRYFKRALEINPQNVTAQNNLQAVSDELPGSPALGLLMIVRNEEDNLNELLPGLAPLFDELTIVDTGSSDGTVEISKKFTNKVFHFSWADDFSAARNFALSNAEADWILWLDADDRMKPEDIRLLRARISGAHKGYFIKVVSDTGHAAVAGSFQLRLFPNIEGIMWEGRVHEQILPSIRRNGLELEFLQDVAVVHEGYGDPAILREKVLRNVSLLEEERGLKPDDPNVLHHLGQAYALLGESEKAIEVLETLVKSPSAQTSNEFLVHAMNTLVRNYFLIGNVEAANKWAERVLEKDPQNRLVRYLLGEMRYHRESFQEAVDWLEQFCSGEEVIGCIPVPWAALEASAYNYLGLAYERIGERERARAEFREAITRGAGAEAYKNLAHVYLEDGNPAEAESILRIAVQKETGDAGIWANLGVALARSQRFEEAANALRRALEIDPDCPITRQNLHRLEGMTHRLPSLSKSFTLSTCIIAKNEAGCLRQAIESVAPVCDEVVVVDTGSTDDTVEIAQSCGAVVRQIEWTDDFAAARNVSLDLARSGWILVIDADEVVAPKDLQALAALRPDPDVWGYSMVTRNYSPHRQVIGWQPVEPGDALAAGQPGWFPSTKVRLFRNHPEIRFEGCIHECVEPSILRATKQIQRLAVPVHHYGYIRDDKGKRRYYLELAEMKARHSRDPRAHLELGIQHMVLGNTEHAETALCNAVKLDPNNDMALLNLAGAKLELGKLAEAQEIMERTVALNPDSACAYYNLGVILEKAGQFEEAERRYSRAVTLDPEDANALAKLGYLSARKGELETARALLERALEFDPTHRHARNNLNYVRKNISPGHGKKCDLSLNMIVKDEEENLKEGLATIAGLFDEIIIVDTGSCDGTVEVAERYGAKVVYHPWNDNFAEARNAALRNSKGKWIFWLDADDRVGPRAVRTLRNFIARGIPCGVFFPLESAIGSSGSVVQNHTLRLFPNRPDITWSGTVHEHIAGSLRSCGVELVNCPDFTIRHIGYEEDGEALKKNLRNLNLLARELAARPEDPYILFALAQAFLFCGQTENAAKWLRLLWELRERAHGAPENDIFWMAAIVLSDCAMRSGNAAEADEWLERAIELSPNDWPAHFLLGERKFLEGDLERARQLIGKAAEIGISTTILPLDINAIRRKLERYLSELKQTPDFIPANKV
ncbi:MAG: tetratricopeptide repeat protein, partial [Candidatus Hydrogenedentota bacterium]